MRQSAHPGLVLLWAVRPRSWHLIGTAAPCRSASLILIHSNANPYGNALCVPATRRGCRQPASLKPTDLAQMPMSAHTHLDSVGNLGVWLTVIASLRQSCGDM